MIWLQVTEMVAFADVYKRQIFSTRSEGKTYVGYFYISVGGLPSSFGGPCGVVVVDAAATPNLLREILSKCFEGAFQVLSRCFPVSLLYWMT